MARSIRMTVSPYRTPFSLLRIRRSKSPSTGSGVDWSIRQAQLTNSFPGGDVCASPGESDTHCTPVLNRDLQGCGAETRRRWTTEVYTRTSGMCSRTRAGAPLPTTLWLPAGPWTRVTWKRSHGEVAVPPDEISWDATGNRATFCWPLSCGDQLWPIQGEMQKRTKEMNGWKRPKQGVSMCSGCIPAPAPCLSSISWGPLSLLGPQAPPFPGETHLSHHVASTLSHLPKRIGHHSFYYFFLFIVKPTKTLSCSHQASDRATLDKLTND